MDEEPLLPFGYASLPLAHWTGVRSRRLANALASKGFPTSFVALRALARKQARVEAEEEERRFRRQAAEDSMHPMSRRLEKFIRSKNGAENSEAALGRNLESLGSVTPAKAAVTAASARAASTGAGTSTPLFAHCGPCIDGYVTRSFILVCVPSGRREEHDLGRGAGGAPRRLGGVQAAAPWPPGPRLCARAVHGSAPRNELERRNRWSSSVQPVARR